MDLLFVFEWLDTSLLAQISKSWGGIFALVQTVHLGSMVVLGGMILLGDLRMLNVLITDVPSDVILKNTTKWIKLALLLIILSGIYEASAIAMKLYYNSFFFAKMIGLGMGMIFLFSIRSAVYRRAPAVISAPAATNAPAVTNKGVPLSNAEQLSEAPEALRPWVVKLVAITHLSIWFSVAASGRWIGFS